MTPGPRWHQPVPLPEPEPLDRRPPMERPPNLRDDRKPHPPRGARPGPELTAVQRDVIRSLAGFHYLTTRQAERLHFRDDSQLTDRAAARRAHRCLATLAAQGLVDRLGRRIGGAHAGSAGFIWRLSPAGSRVAGTPRHRRLPEPGHQHLAHCLDVAELAVSLHEHARQADDLHVVAIETEPDCWRPLPPARPGRPRWLKPDLRVTLRVPGRELHWFLEVDRGHEHRGALTHKLTAYMAAWRDGTEATITGVFPRVLWVVPTPARADELTHLCATTPGVPAGMFTVATRNDAIATLTEVPA